MPDNEEDVEDEEDIYDLFSYRQAVEAVSTLEEKEALRTASLSLVRAHAHRILSVFPWQKVFPKP